ncbi:MAG: helix-turn-helix domain-containing protein [Pseudomonadota bacterium]
MRDVSLKPPSDEDEHTLLTTVEAADFLRVTRSTLDHYRCIGRGPTYRKHEVRVFYTKASLIRWSQRHAYTSTSSRVRPKS